MLLLLCFVPAFLYGCARDQYAVEREYWMIKKQAESIFTNPAATPPNELARVAEQLNRFVENHPKNILALESEFMIARLYLVKEEYEASRKHLNQMIEKYRESPVIKSEAVFLIGNSYQLQDKWDAALDQYKKIIAEYPLTTKGLETPIYIAQYYNVKHYPDKMRQAYQEAISHYQSLISQYPDSPLAMQSYKLIASCYTALKDWPNAVAVLNTVVEKFKAKTPMDAILLDIALIYKKELNDTAKTKETLETLIKEYPKSKLAGVAKALLSKMQ